AVMLKFLPVSHPEELTQILIAPQQTNVTTPLSQQIQERQDVFSGVFAYSGDRFDLAQGGESRYISGNWVSGEFFSTRGVKPALGRVLNPDDDKRGGPAVAVITHAFWQSHYGGDPAIVGKSIMLDKHSFDIVGVTSPGFYGVDVGDSVSVFI